MNITSCTFNDMYSRTLNQSSDLSVSLVVVCDGGGGDDGEHVILDRYHGETLSEAEFRRALFARDEEGPSSTLHSQQVRRRWAASRRHTRVTVGASGTAAKTSDSK